MDNHATEAAVAQCQPAAPDLPGPLDFAVLYQQYAAPLYLFFYQQVGNPQDAEDLTAATFSRALISLGRYQEQGRLAAWLFSIARHTLQDERRRRRPHTNIEHVAALVADPGPQPETQAIESEQARLLQDLVLQLPADQQAALTLRFFGELSIGEIARLMGRSAGAIKMLIHRAIGRLREQCRAAEHVAAPISLACLGFPQLQYAPRPAFLPIRCPRTIGRPRNGDRWM